MDRRGRQWGTCTAARIDLPAFREFRTRGPVVRYRYRRIRPDDGRGAIGISAAVIADDETRLRTGRAGGWSTGAGQVTGGDCDCRTGSDGEGRGLAHLNGEIEIHE